MTIKAICDKVQDVTAAVAGITSAPKTWPGGLNSAELPLTLTRPGKGFWESTSFGKGSDRRTYVVDVYVAPVGQGLGVDEGVQEALTLLEALGQAYLASPTLGGIVLDVEPRDLGLQVLTYAGVNYRGLTFELDVTEDK